MQELRLCDADRLLISNLTDALRQHNRLTESQRSERLYSQREAARLLGKSEMTIYNWLRKGIIAKITANGHTGIPQSEIDKHLKLNNKNGTN